MYLQICRVLVRSTPPPCASASAAPASAELGGQQLELGVGKRGQGRRGRDKGLEKESERDIGD